jgi:hypothetical protein
MRLVMTPAQAYARADLILEIARLQRESDAEIKALVKAIKELDADRQFLRELGIAVDFEPTEEEV